MHQGRGALSGVAPANCAKHRSCRSANHPGSGPPSPPTPSPDRAGEGEKRRYRSQVVGVAVPADGCDSDRLVRPACGAPSFPAANYNGWMTVTVLLFASVAERVGARKLELPLEPGDSVATVRDRLVERFPQLRECVPTLLYALDEAYAKESSPVTDGATLALIPPVSGG